MMLTAAGYVQSAAGDLFLTHELDAGRGIANFSAA
jgi:hypothetical protein